MEPSPYPRHEGYVAEKLEMVNKAAGFLWRRMRAAFKPRKEAAREVPPGAVQQQAATVSRPPEEPLQKEHPSLVQEAASGSHAILEKMHADSEAVSEVTKEELDRWRGHGGPGSLEFASHVVEERGGAHERHPPGAPSDQQSKPGLFERWASSVRRALDSMKSTGVPRELEDMREAHHHGIKPASIASHPLITG